LTRISADNRDCFLLTDISKKQLPLKMKTKSQSIDQISKLPQPPRLEKPVRITEQSWPEGTVPVVSVFCITYNHEKFIRDAIEGFLMQETTFPVEIFIHDDASTDGTPDIVREYQAKYPHLFRTVLQTKNQYSDSGYRFLFEYLTKQHGEFIALCEGDDYWMNPHKLQKQVDILQSDPGVSLVFHNAWVKHEKSRFDYFLNGGVGGGIDKSRFTLLDIIEREWFIATASIVFRRCPPLPREILDYSIVGDLLIHLNACLHGDAVYVDQVNCVYRRHVGGVSDQYMKKKRLLYEKMRVNHFWMYWMFGEYIAPEYAIPSVVRRMRNLVRSVLQHALTDDNHSSCKTARALSGFMQELLSQNRPSVASAEAVADKGFIGRMVESESRAVYGKYRRGLILQRLRHYAIKLWQLGKKIVPAQDLCRFERTR